MTWRPLVWLLTTTTTYAATGNLGTTTLVAALTALGLRATTK